jgi:hypothetical protein
MRSSIPAKPASIRPFAIASDCANRACNKWFDQSSGDDDGHDAADHADQTVDGRRVLDCLEASSVATCSMFGALRDERQACLPVLLSVNSPFID